MQNHVPLVSVIVRSMDRPSLAAALASIERQAFRPIEVLVVNATGRPHGALPAECAGRPLRLLRAAGPALPRAAAANAGLDAAQGECVGFLDDDDLLLPDHVGKLVDALQRQPDAVAVFSDVELGRNTERGWESTHCFGTGFDRIRLRFENFLPIHAVLIHRVHSPAVAQCRFDEQFALFEDWDYWLQLSELGPMIHVPGVSARYVAAADGNSGVFDDSMATRDARVRLFAKWQCRSTAEDHAALLGRLQALHRNAATLQAELGAAQARLASTVAAREAEIAAHAAAAADPRAVIAAREAEIAAHAAAGADLRAVIVAREAEIAAHAAAAADLKAVIADRETEVANALREIGALKATLAARDNEIEAWRAALAARETELTALKSTLAARQAEGPLKALARAVKDRLDERR